MRKLLGILIVLALMMGVVGAASAAAPTTVYLVNTLDRDIVDVYVDGNLIIEDFAHDTILGPFVGAFDGEVRIEMIPANQVLGEENPFYIYYPVAVTHLPAGETVAFVAQEDNTPGSLGSLRMISYDLAPTGPGQATVMFFNALSRSSIEAVVSPGTANEQSFDASTASYFKTRLPAVPTTVSLFEWSHNPNPEFLGTFTGNLQPGKLYVAFVYYKFGVGLFMLRQEFNVGQ